MCGLQRLQGLGFSGFANLLLSVGTFIIVIETVASSAPNDLGQQRRKETG